MRLQAGMSLLLLFLSFVCLAVPGAESMAGICFVVGAIGVFTLRREERA